MVVPCCRVFSVGEVTAWGQQFLTKLKSDNVIEVSYEPSLEKFCDSMKKQNETVIAVIENCPGSMKWIQFIRNSGVSCFLIWYGRGFNKEEMTLAVKYRVHQVFEDARAESEEVKVGIRETAQSRDRQMEMQQILHSIKTTLLQSEDEPSAEIFSSIRAALGKLEKSALGNDFQGKVETRSETRDTIPFHKSQLFADSLSTIHDLERTGILLVKGGLSGQEGMVEFLQGKIVGAGAGQVHGIKSIYRMFLWDDPKFIFTKKDPDDFLLEEHLTVAMKYIRKEGTLLRNRFDEIRRELPPPELRLELDPNALHGGVKLNKEEFSTLASVIEFGRVSQVLDYNELPDVTIYESLIKLKRNHLIRVSMAAAA